MSNKEEEIEKIAREEVFPARYYDRQFPGEWPSEDHRRNCHAIAESIYEGRANTASASETPTVKAKPLGRRPSSVRKEKSELDQRERSGNSGDEQQTGSI